MEDFDPLAVPHPTGLQQVHHVEGDGSDGRLGDRFDVSRGGLNDWRRASTRVAQDDLRMSHLLARASYRVPCKSVLPQCQARVFCKSVLQECPKRVCTRVPYKRAPQERLARVSCKNVLEP